MRTSLTSATVKLLLLLVGVGLLCPVARSSDLVKIEGLSSITLEQAEEWLESQVTYIESAGVSPARADDVAYFLENAMRDRGYDKAVVDWKVQGDEPDQIILLTVNEGQTEVISAYDITGNIALEDAAVIELLTDSTRKRLGIKVADSVPYVKSDINSGRKKLDDFYTLLGFGDIETETETRPGPSGLTLNVIITEGLEHVVGSIEFPAAPDDQIAKVFADAYSDFNGKKFNPAIQANLKSRVLSNAVNAGYYEAVVKVVESSHRKSEGQEIVDLTVEVEWGPAISISGISVKGNEKVKHSFFDHQFKSLVGQPYSPGSTNKKVEELLETGAFETMRTVPVHQPDGSVHLDIEVKESYSRTLGVFGGFTNYDGPIGGFEFRNLNLFGAVRTINAEIEFSGRGGRGEIEYVDPWFLESDVSFTARAFTLNRSEEGYDKWETGGRYEFTKRFGHQNCNAITFFGNASYTDVYDAEIAPAFLGDTQYLAHFVGLSYTLDKRDKPQQPRKGFLAQGSASVATSAIGSEVDFFRATGRVAYYHPVGNHNFRMAARVGGITPIGDTISIPIDLRFYNGGPNSVRSFQERALGPLDPSSGHQVGGQFFTVFNAEYEVPIKYLTGLNFVVFGDAGNLLAGSGSPSLDNMRYAVGAGLRYMTPIGPLRFEYGYNPDQQPNEPQGTFHVAFGFAF